MAALVVVLWHPVQPQARQGDLVLFCAAGLLRPVQEICADYEKQYGVKVRIEPDASGALLAKIRVAPSSADLFLAAEESYVRDLKAQKLVAETLPVARQHVVIAVKPGNPQKIAAAADLLRDDVKVALPNPELAAVGKAAQRALAASGEWEALQRQTKEFRAKVSLVGKVTEAAEHVKVGAVDAAIVWDATARQFDLEIVEIPAFQKQPPELVMLGVLAGTSKPSGALHFARYLTASNRGEVVFQKHYVEPLADADRWENRPALVLMAGAMLKPAIDDLVKSFSRREGVDITTIFAGCGIHVAQMTAMKKGEAVAAHFPDAYFACDVSFMNKVQQWFEASRVISRNDMVLAVPSGNPKQIQSVEDLARPELRVGLGHPKNSALGALTDDLLRNLGLHEKVYAPDRGSPVIHTDAGHMLVNQMRTGALDLIVVYRSNVLSAAETAKTSLEIVEMNLPEAKAIQPFAVAKDSQHKYLMRRLLEAILSPQSQKHFHDEGFQWLAEGEPR
jgi:molybdenum ABC transporter molybdate-binding protein